ncbi:MAG TPA: hypothetical protein VEI73_00140 [Candidatus Acidoferrum sp.]|nr:hypothetical protein [Candidatus Acidoferrum sp.]
MRKLAEVQEAKALMNEAMDWSVFTWLFEKSRVRETADEANAALDALERAVKGRWSDEAKAAYKNLTRKTAKAARKGQTDPKPEQTVDRAILDLIEKVAEADAAAKRARMDAENTFDEAEKRLSVTLAREGCEKAIHSWSLHEKAIRRAEAVAETPRA